MLRSGTVDPTGADGVDGEFYINTATDFIFGPKAGGVWPAGVSLIGAKGPKGDTGAQGPSGVTAYRYGGFAAASILASEILMEHVVTLAHSLPANFAGSKASVGVSPAATWTANVQKNGANVGTISISTGGVVTFATTGGSAVALVPGDVVTLVAPGTADTTIARLRFTFEGTV
jgi:hypothetical protein